MKCLKKQNNSTTQNIKIIGKCKDQHCICKKHQKEEYEKGQHEEQISVRNVVGNPFHVDPTKVATCLTTCNNIKSKTLKKDHRSYLSPVTRILADSNRQSYE